jgi:drug/metabolite transporter (DMT)-like permease
MLREGGPMTRPVASAALLLAAFFWGSGNVANKTVLDHIGPILSVALRCCLGVLIVLPFALRDLRCRPTAAWVQSATMVTFFFAAAMALQQYAFQGTTVTNAGFLVNTCSIMTPCLAWLLLRERSPRRILGAAVITVFGVFLMTGGQFSFAAMQPGDITSLGAAVCYATWMVLTGHHLVRFGRPMLLCACQFGFGGAGLMLLAFAVETPAIMSARAALPELLYLGFVSTGLAFLLQVRAQEFVSSSRAAILTSAESLFGAAGAYLLLQERTGGMGLVGAALIICGIGLAAVCPRPAPQPPVGNGSDKRSARRRVPAG